MKPPRAKSSLSHGLRYTHTAFDLESEFFSSLPENKGPEPSISAQKRQRYSLTVLSQGWASTSHSVITQTEETGPSWTPGERQPGANM